MIKVRIEVVANTGDSEVCEISDITSPLSLYTLGCAVGRAVAGASNLVEWCNGSEFRDGLNEYLPADFRIDTADNTDASDQSK